MNRTQANELAMMEVVEQFLLQNSEVVVSAPELREAVEEFRAALKRVRSTTAAAGESDRSDEISGALRVLENRVDPLVKPMAYGEKQVFASSYKIARILVNRSRFVDPELPQAEPR